MQTVELSGRVAGAFRAVLLTGVLLALLSAPSFASATKLPAAIKENTTLTAAGSPYTGGTVIESGVTVGVEPGVLVTEANFIVKGTLDAKGTAENPIVFKDTISTAAVTFEPGSGASVLSRVEVRNAGFSTGCCGKSRPSIWIKKSSPTITDTTVLNSREDGIRVEEGGAPEIADNHVINSKGKAIQYRAIEPSYSGEVNIHDNLIEGGGLGIDVYTEGASIVGKSLGGNTINGTEGLGLSYRGSAMPGDITDNALAGNKDNVIQIGGEIKQSATWNDGGTTVRFDPWGAGVMAGVTLTIAKGLNLTASQLIVKGTLDAQGTAEDPIVFNGANNTAAITFEPGSGASTLNHVEVIDSGYTTGCCGKTRPSIWIKKSSPTIVNSTVLNSREDGIRIAEGGAPEIADNEIISSKGEAIEYRATEPSYSGEVNIHDNLIEGGSAGIDVYVGGSAISGKSLGGNTVSGTEGLGLSYRGQGIPNNITGNTLVGNKDNVIQIGGEVKQSGTWSDGGTTVRFDPWGVEVMAGVTLTIAKGIDFTKAQLIVKGTLDAQGTAEDPIVFNGANNTAAITFEPGSGASTLNHVEVIDSGYTTGCCGKTRPSIWIKKSSPTITNSTVFNSRQDGIRVEEGGAPEIADNDIINSYSTAIYYRASELSHTGEINIHGNAVEGGGSGIDVNATGSAVGAKTLGTNTVIGTNGVGLSYQGPAIPGNITGNTLIANKENVINITGTVASSSTWNNGGAPVRFISGGVLVNAGVTLTITKGVYLRNPTFIVKGTLKAEGTESEPVVFTGINRVSPGEWGNIKFEPGSGASVIDYAEVAFGGASTSSGMIEAKGSSPKITHSTIRKAKYSGIKVTESGSPTIEWNSFRANGSGLSYSGTGKLNARNNDWGCANGPSPAGCGDSASSNVEWKPAVQLPELNGQCRGKESQCKDGADPVSLATGALNYSHRDLSLTNKGRAPLEFSRAYYSGSASDTGLGPGWSQTGLASATELESGTVLILRQDGRQDLFYKTGEGTYKAPAGVSDQLTKVEGTFQLTTLENTVYRFDASGRIASITDDHGLKTTYAYDGNGRLATITDPSAQTLTFSYNASNHITSVKDSTGREVKYTYSGAGDLATVTDALGGITEYTYDAEHRLKTIKDPRGNVILKNTYDGQGRITEQRDGLENLWLLSYKAGETVVTEPEGGKLTYGFDGQGRVVSEKDQLGHVTAISYDAAGNVDEIIKPGGAKWQFGHDAKGNLTSVIDPEEGERSYEYDGKNRLTSFTDEREETWAYEWSEANDLKKITDPAEGETTFTHDAAGLPLTVTDPNEHTTTFTYDVRGNRLTAKDALEHKTSFEYNTRNYLISKTAPGLKAEGFERNALGDLLARTTPEGNKTKYAYDANGMPTQITDPGEGVWKIAYNAMERPTTYTDPLEQQTKVFYNGNLKPTKVINRRGKETTYGYDLANQVTAVHAPEGGDWTFGYDSRGNRLSVVDPREGETTYEYDLLNRMTESVEPLEATTSYEYDPAGNLTSFTDPDENTTGLVYDELGQLTEVNQPLGKVTSFGYDGVGNRTSRTTSEGTVGFDYDAADRLEEISDGESTLRSYGYDSANRMIGAIDAQADEVKIGYDEDGRVVSINDGRGQTMTRKYDSRGNVTQQTDGRGTLKYGFDKLSRVIALTDPQGEVLDFEYDPEGDLTKVELPNGVVTANEYDDAGRLTATASTKGEAALESFDYEYDPFGNRIGQVDRLSQKTAYEYDALNRLIEFDPPGEGSTAYGYDPAGNRTEAGGTTYSFNALNQLTSASNGTTYDYDDAGRLIEVDPGETSTTYGWSALDELTSVDTGAQEIDYAYDAFGRQVLRDDGSTIRPSHYGDLSDIPILDTDAEGKPTMSYVQGPEGLVEQRSGEATGFPLRDAHGDITTLADGEGGVASRQTYDPWGDQISGPSLEMGWLGAQQRRSDGATGLVQMGIRSYSPTMGSFSTEDPILGHLGISATINRYVYAWDNPLLYYDLNGRSVLGVAGGVIGDTWNVTGGRAWDETAGARDILGVAGDGNGGWLNETPGFVSDRSMDLIKEINLSTEELIAAGASSLGTAGICGIAALGATSVGTPVAGAAAAGLCVTIEAIGTVETINDIFDDENGLPTDELFE